MCLDPVLERTNVSIEKVLSDVLSTVGRGSLVCVCEKNTTWLKHTKSTCVLKVHLGWFYLSNFYKFVHFKIFMGTIFQFFFNLLQFCFEACVILALQLICRVHQEKRWAGGSTSCNQDCWEKYKSPPMCRWHHPYGREQRRTKGPLHESERGE